MKCIINAISRIIFVESSKQHALCRQLLEGLRCEPDEVADALDLVKPLAWAPQLLHRRISLMTAKRCLYSYQCV